MGGGLTPLQRSSQCILQPQPTGQPIDRVLSGATTPGQSGSGNDGSEGVVYIPQSCSITGTSSSDCLMSYLEHLLEGYYPSAEKQSVYSTTPADWAKLFNMICLHTMKWLQVVLFKTKFQLLLSNPNNFK